MIASIRAPAQAPPQASLPIIGTCERCGACCMEQGAPPFVFNFSDPAGSDPRDAEDRDSYARMTPEARALYDTPSTIDGPCVWLNLETKRCRFYDLRPSICRQFRRGSSWCRTWRNDFAIPKPAAGA